MHTLPVIGAFFPLINTFPLLDKFWQALP